MINQIKQQVIAAKQEGKTYSQIYCEFGVAKSTARDWIIASRGTTDVSETFVNPNLNRIKPKKAEANYDEIKEFLSQLSPVVLKKPTPQELKTSVSSYAVVIGDTHFGSSCQKTLNIFYQVIDELKPTKIILNGDTLDMTAISRYPKDIRYDSSLKKERDEYHQCLATLKAIAPTSEIIETNANHSGNSVEGRWWRYLSDRLGELGSLPEIQAQLSYEKVFLPENSGVELVDFVQLSEDFVVMHGDVVRKHGGYSAMGMLEKWNTSVMMNHTHRVGMTALRRPAIGNKGEHLIKAYENGCACDLSPVYASAPNWQNGFSIVSLDKKDCGVEQVVVNNGVANIATLGLCLKS